jgi:hypothetical protein
MLNMIITVLNMDMYKNIIILIKKINFKVYLTFELFNDDII